MGNHLLASCGFAGRVPHPHAVEPSAHGLQPAAAFPSVCCLVPPTWEWFLPTLAQPVELLASWVCHRTPRRANATGWRVVCLPYRHCLSAAFMRVHGFRFYNFFLQSSGSIHGDPPLRSAFRAAPGCALFSDPPIFGSAFGAAPGWCALFSDPPCLIWHSVHSRREGGRLSSFWGNQAASSDPISL